MVTLLESDRCKPRQPGPRVYAFDPLHRRASAAENKWEQGHQNTRSPVGNAQGREYGEFFSHCVLTRKKNNRFLFWKLKKKKSCLANREKERAQSWWSHSLPATKKTTKYLEPRGIPAVTRLHWEGWGNPGSQEALFIIKAPFGTSRGRTLAFRQSKLKRRPLPTNVCPHRNPAGLSSSVPPFGGLLHNHTAPFSLQAALPSSFCRAPSFNIPHRCCQAWEQIGHSKTPELKPHSSGSAFSCRTVETTALFWTLSFPRNTGQLVVKSMHFGDFPGDPVAKIPSPQCRGLGAMPGQGTRSTCCN